MVSVVICIGGIFPPGMVEGKANALVIFGLLIGRSEVICKLLMGLLASEMVKAPLKVALSARVTTSTAVEMPAPTARLRKKACRELAKSPMVLVLVTSKVCSTSVSEMWVKKALDISLPVEDEMQNGASYVLLGRTAMTVCRYDVALRAFNSAERFQGQSSIAKFYLAELFFRKKEYEETRRILTSLGESVELPPIMRDRVHYWTNAV